MLYIGKSLSLQTVELEYEYEWQGLHSLVFKDGEEENTKQHVVTFKKIIMPHGTF